MSHLIRCDLLITHIKDDNLEEREVKRNLYLLALTLIVLIVIVVGCQLSPAGPELEIRLAPIHEV